METQSTIAKAIRVIGVIAMISSGIQFLVSGRYSLNSLDSHYIFLGINVLINILGFFTYKYWKEIKTTRTFSALSLAMIPAHMAQLGAFILDSLNINIHAPSLLKLSLPIGASVYWVSFITLVVVVPITFLGFKFLVRKIESSISWSYLLCSLMLLLPYRTDGFMACILGLTFLVNINALINVKKIDNANLAFVKFIIFIPNIILFGRSFLYPMPESYYMYLMLLSSYILYKYSRLFIEKESTAKIVQGIYVPLLFGGLSRLSIIFELDATLLFIVFVIVVYALSYRSIGNGRRYRIFSSAFLSLVLVGIYSSYGYMVQVLTLSIPAYMLFRSYNEREKLPFYFSLATVTIYGIMTFSTVLNFSNLKNWYVLSVLGIILIFVAGYLEKSIGNISKKVRIVLREFN